MYICNDCERTFEECGTYEEHHPCGMGTAAETFYCCPYCKSDDFEEAKRCEHCGEYVAELHEGMCDICYDDMKG